MKITIVMPAFNLSGGDRVLATYVQHLSKRNHQVFAVSPARRQPKLRQQVRSLFKGQGWVYVAPTQPSHFANKGVAHHVLPHPAPITDADLPDADVVVATWWETAEWVAKLSDAKGAKAYFIQHHEVHDYLPQARVKATYSLPLHKIVIAQWLADLMQTEYRDRHVALVPNSVDLEMFAAPPRSKQPVPTIGMMYSPVYWKGCNVSLKALSLAAEKIPNLRSIAFGRRSPSPELPLPPGTEYICQPPQDTLKDIYSQCDAWLFGSRSEGFGLPILEAMACRTPVIGTPAGAAPELLADGAGILVRPEDPDNMARAIEQICNFSEAEWLAVSDAAYAKATSYTWEKATDLFESALQVAIDRREKGDFTAI
ncbi:MAG: glycosyltransferase family 4 protein [Cyanosarcina radialis HA8281-LM2]|jgi:glycosyltransferase involved in cell wall biosynthesis|nr:glycosyltransferase family 4 protein [Cyanosarcina radialis HA8281-LM2]